MRTRIIIILLLIPVFSFAQKQTVQNKSVYDMKTWHFGFTVGLNAMDFSIKPSNEAYTSFGEVDTMPCIPVLQPGFNINVVTSLRLNKYMNLRFLPGISFGQRDIEYYDDAGNSVLERQSLESSFIELPLILKYRSERVNNFRPYLISGVNMRLDLASRKEYEETGKRQDNFVLLKMTDIYGELGFGIDFFLPYFKLSTELKYSVGMRDMLRHDSRPGQEVYVNTIEKLNSRMWVLSFHFE